MKTKCFFFLLMLAFSALNGSERNIALLVNPKFIGETSLAYRIKSACENINWNVEMVHNSQKLKKNNYDFVIQLTPGNNKERNCKNYLAIFHPVHHFFNAEGFLKKAYRSYDGYLLTYSPDSLENKMNDFVDTKKFPYIQWYPTVQNREYKIVDPSHLFFICCTWGNRFRDVKFKQFLKLLDKESYSRFYGNKQFSALYPQSYHGEIPYDYNSLNDIASEAGVSLVIHSLEHNLYGLPSGRIFEAAAASTVIICDQNSFVRANFGDSVLYINTDLDAQSIFRQVQVHMNWIKENKLSALEKAKRAHEIFIEKFLLENQLVQLGELHDRLSFKS